MVLHAIRMIDETTTAAVAPLTIADGQPKPDNIKCTEPMVRTSMSNNRTTTSMSSPMPPPVRYNKPPIYTSDKRAKFTQRENKKWVRLATVIGYLISVCMPAVALSIYYIGFWNPQYDAKFLSKNASEMTNLSQQIKNVEKRDTTTTTNERIWIDVIQTKWKNDEKQCSCKVEEKTEDVRNSNNEQLSETQNI